MNYNPPIALVGLSLRLPGGANDVEALWKLLESGQSADRYSTKLISTTEQEADYSGRHFISSDLRDFDHTFFHFSKSEAATLDPQQRLLMELAYEALESGGISCQSIAGTATSVYAAMSPLHYNRQLYKERSILSNRLSQVLDLRGPSLTIDTACSGGLAALHLACQSLRTGESNAAIVAASNLILGPDQFIGRSHPMDDPNVDNGRGEGAVVLVLKRLDDAIRDRDPVRAVVRSTAVGRDGYAPQNITYPNGQAQASLARSTYVRAGLQPEEDAYVETHGSGTDKEELRGIAEVFASTNTITTTNDRPLPLYVGSIMGVYTEGVAGLASLVKAAIILDRELIPPVAGFAHPKQPGLPLNRMSIPTHLVPWPRVAGVTPRISINSFDFGCTNAHAIVERGPRATRVSSAYDDDIASPLLFTFSANSAVSLKAMIKAQHSWVEQRSETTPWLADLSYTLLHRRTALPYRFSVVARDRASFLDALSEARVTTKPIPAKLDIVAVFTGQGAQWAGMGRELLLETTTSSVFRDSVRVSRDILHGLGAAWDLETELLRDAAQSRINDAEIAQPATTAIQIALVALFRAQGVRPGAVVGHSSGEIAAAYAAGYLSHENAVKAAFHAGFMAAAIKAKGLGRGTMLSVGLSEQDAAKYLEGLVRGKVAIACVNSPRSVTIAGDADAVDEVDQRIAAANDGTFHRKLLVDTAYHSHHMSAVADDYRARLDTLKGESRSKGTATATDPQGKDTVAFVSSVTGQSKTSGFDAEYWVSNLVFPVRFADAIQVLARERHVPGQHVFFIEIGPHPALSGPVKQTLQHLDAPKFLFDYQAPLQRNVGATESALAVSGKLFERGVSIQWDAVSALAPAAGTAVVRHDLPPYPWDHSTKHWCESRVSRAHRFCREPYHDLLGVPVPDAPEIEPRWRHFLSKTTLPWLEDHVVDGQTVFPGSGYMCMAIEAVSQLARRDFPQRPLETLALRDVFLKERGLIVPDTQWVEVQLSLRPRPSSDLAFNFTVMALAADDGQWHEQAVGVVDGVLADEEGVLTETAVEEEEELPALPPGCETLPREALYREIYSAGNKYGPAFAGLDFITLAADASHASSSFGVPDIQASMPAKYQHPHIIHPSTLEAVLHSTLPLVSRRLDRKTAMPVHIDELLVSAISTLHKPGSRLDVSTLLRSSHSRTATCDVSVLASGRRVLSASGMELRSITSNVGGITPEDLADDVNGSTVGQKDRSLCYELDWQTDVEYVSAEDLPEEAALADVIALTTAKRHGLTTIGLGVNVDLSADYLNAVAAIHRNEVASHDFVDASPGRFDDAVERLKDFPVQYRTMRPGVNPVARGFEAGAYDVVLAASAKWLNQAAVLVRPGGTVLLILSARDSKDDNGWRIVLQGTTLKEQFALHTQDGGLIVVAKASDIRLPADVQILTHSPRDAAETPTWVTAVEEGLRARNVNVSLDTLSPSKVKALEGAGATEKSSSGSSNNNINNGNSDDAIIIVDDKLGSPILADSAAFDAVRDLLSQRSAALVWLSPDDPVIFHQNEGLARTAYSENDGLRLVTIHAASALLANESAHERLVDVVAGSVSKVAVPSTGFYAEREYRIRADGTVMVPRLRRSERLNQAIANKDVSHFGPGTEHCRFADQGRPLIISPDGSAAFVDDVHAAVYSTPLSNDELDLDVQAVAVSETHSTAPWGEYVGIVTRVGSHVESLAPGNRVVGLAPIVGASRLRIPHIFAARLPPNVHSTTASALLLDTVAASYALRGIARLLSCGGTVLVHGARTAAGRAAVTIARSIGARVVATAADQAEVRLLNEQVGIDEADMLVSRRSLYRRSPGDVFGYGFDVLVHTDEHVPPPAEVLAHVKPFGSVFVLGRSPLPIKLAPKMLSNVGFYTVDIASILQVRPDLAAIHVAEAAAALELFPLSGLTIPVRDVAEIADSLRLIKTGVHAKVVLEAGPNSTVPVVVSAAANPKDAWTDENATYVIVGGLGDLGQMFIFLMVRRGANHIAIISHGTVEPGTHDALQTKLETIRSGIRLYTLQCDVTSESSVQAAAATLSHQGAPPVRGIIQCAVVMNVCPPSLPLSFSFSFSLSLIFSFFRVARIANSLCSQKDHPFKITAYDDFRSVTRIKVDGTLNIHHAFASPDLAFFISLSSVAGIVGASAKAGYNAGNTMQDALAHQEQQEQGLRSSEKTRFVSVSLGWIEDDASWTVNDEARPKAPSGTGLRPMRKEELLSYFDYILGTTFTGQNDDTGFSQAIIGFDSESLLTSATSPNSTIYSPLFSELGVSTTFTSTGEATGGGGGGENAPASQTFEQVVAEGNAEAMVSFISHAVTTQLARLVSIDVRNIDATQGSMLALGLDSLVAVELRNWVLRQFNATLQSAEILTHQTVQTLAEKIATRSKLAARAAA